MNKPKLIYLPESDEIDMFAPEQDSDPRRGARVDGTEQAGDRRGAHEISPEHLNLFGPESFANAPHLAPPRPPASREAIGAHARDSYPSRPRIHPAALAAVAGMTAVFAIVLVQQSTAPESTPVAPVASSATEAPVPPPPVTSETPAPSTADAAPVDVSPPEAIVAQESPVVTVPQDPPSSVPARRAAAPERPTAVPESRTAVSAPADTPPRMPRPLSQDPGRLAAGAVTAAPTPRPGADVPVRPPTTAANPSPPAVSSSAASSAAIPSASPPPSAPPPSVTPAPAPSPSPPAVSPPTAAATTPPAPSATAGSVRPPAPAAAPPAAAASVIDTNTTGIQNTLARYRQAFNTLSASAAREVWPTVNEQTLSRAFDRLDEQQLSFEGCQIEVNDARAEARCNGTARYVPRVGSRTPRVERREWRFSLVKSRDEWLIGAVDAR